MVGLVFTEPAVIDRDWMYNLQKFQITEEDTPPSCSSYFFGDPDPSLTYFQMMACRTGISSQKAVTSFFLYSLPHSNIMAIR